MLQVIVNPGHSDTDPGAIGPTGLHEADVALHVAHALLARGGGDLDYVGRRQEPGSKGLGQLLLWLKRVRPPIVLSIHCNAYQWKPGHCLHRAEAYYWQADPDSTRRRGSLALATEICHMATGPDGYAETALLKSAPYQRRRADGTTYAFVPAVIRDSASIAAVLVEMGYIKDPHTEAAMRTREWVRRAAASLDGALRSFAREWAILNT